MNILVVYYSTYGHLYRLANAVVEGAAATGANVRLARVQELIPQEVIDGNEGMKCGCDLQKDIPLARIDDAAWADGIAFGSPTRFGNMAAQMKNYIDQLGPLWAQGALEGKPGTCFTSSNTMHGGQESTLFTMWLPLIHLGMLVLGVPYSVSELMSTQSGGGPYGATTVAGAGGELLPNPTELTIARIQGKRLAEITAKVRG